MDTTSTTVTALINARDDGVEGVVEKLKEGSGDSSSDGVGVDLGRYRRV